MGGLYERGTCSNRVSIQRRAGRRAVPGSNNVTIVVLSDGYTGRSRWWGTTLVVMCVTMLWRTALGRRGEKPR